MLSKNKKIYQIMDILKAFAILFVIITHTNFMNIYRRNIFCMFFINMAVPMFMLVTGFNYSNSLENTKISEVKNIIIKRIKRLTIPFLIILCIEWIFNIGNIKSHHFLTAFINGGVGPGSYYYPVMLQIIVLYPIIYWTLRKYNKYGLIGICGLQFLFELICAIVNIDLYVYRILALRYLSPIALGTWLVVKKEKISENQLLLMEIIGINFITILICSNNTIDYYPFVYWSKTSLLTYLYIFPIFAYLYYRFKDDEIKNKFINGFTYIGKSSWHIFLIQMLYFAIINSEYKNTVSFWIIPISIFVCVILGVLFYKFEKLLKKFLNF